MSPKGGGAPRRVSRSGEPKSNSGGRRPPPTRRSPTPGRVPAKRIPAGRATGRVGGSSRPQRGLGGDQVEGRQAVRELLIAGNRRVREVWLSTENEPTPVLQDIVELAQSRRVAVRDVGKSKFAAQARTDTPQGVLALAAPLPEAELSELLEPPSGRPPFLLALDGVTDPQNLGALLRTAECAGVTGVLLPRHRAVHVTPAVTKAAAGAIEHLPIALVGGLPNALLDLEKAGVWRIGLDAAGDTSLFDGLPAASSAVCVVLGAEGAGLARLVRQRCDVIVGIPVMGQLGHLNVSVAGALALYEVTRARA